MHIFFTRFPLESQFGGAEVQTLSLMEGLKERGHHVAFLGSCPVLLEKCFALSVPYFDLNIGPPPVTKWHAISFLWRQFLMRKKLINAINEQPVTRNEQRVIFMLSLSEKLLLTTWAAQNKIPVFWIEHDSIGRWLRWNPWLPKLRRLSRLATTVAVSDMSKRMYLDLGWNPENTVVIPNGIDLRKFYKRQKILRSTTFHIGCVARLSPEKGVDILIKAVKNIPNIHLTIVGTGRDENCIRKLLEQSTLETHSNDEGQVYHLSPTTSVTILPSVPDIVSFYHSLDLFILPSRDHDPCPLAPIEAMACGIPTIMTDACGTAQYVENGKEAIVVPAGNTEVLHEAIKQTTLRTYEAASVQNTFSFERMIDRYELLFAHSAKL